MITTYNFPDFELLLATEDISLSTEWRVEDERHQFIVHLDGHMEKLETEIEGHAGCRGPAVPGEVWSVPAGHNYKSRATGEVIRYAVVSLDASKSKTTDVEILAGRRDDHLFALIRELAENVDEHGHAVESPKQQLSNSISVHLWNNYSLGGRLRRPLAPRFTDGQAKFLRDHIYENLNGPITVDDLATLVGFTSHHLLVAFRSAFGTTPAQYLIDQRIRKSQWLLLHTSKEITSIAMDTGFASHSHLSTAFKNRVGCSPSEFRTRHK